MTESSTFTPPPTVRQTERGPLTPINGGNGCVKHPALAYIQSLWFPHLWGLGGLSLSAEPWGER
jgi:hypothetical protein